MNDSGKPDSCIIEQLVKRSQAGEREAFDELVCLYQRRAMRVTIRLLGDTDGAAEAVQVSFVKAYLNIDKLRKPKRFEPWLLKIITNTAISQRRAAARREREIRLTDSYEQAAALTIAEQTSGEFKEVIREAMLKLSKKEAKAISLFGLENMSHKEAAEIMGCSVETVRWYVFRARKKLKVLLKEYL